MEPALFDASVYISALRAKDHGVLSARSLHQDSPLWLSAVVLEELYAGVSDRDRHLIERLERDFVKIERILTPNLQDWTRVGRILSQLAAKYDYEKIGRARLTNDALIASSAGRMGIRVLTANERAFRKLAEFQLFRWELAKLA
jgi:predicted nucleic acid-binding protein